MSENVSSARIKKKKKVVRKGGEKKIKDIIWHDMNPQFSHRPSRLRKDAVEEKGKQGQSKIQRPCEWWKPGFKTRSEEVGLCAATVELYNSLPVGPKCLRRFKGSLEEHS